MDHCSEKLSAEHPGEWFSSLEWGDCAKNGLINGGKNCTWNVTKVEKIVTSKCHSDSFFGAVQACY